MKKIIRVFSPASVSNVGSGFDIMGFAIDGCGDIIEIELNGSGEISIDNKSSFKIPLDPERNVVFPALNKMIHKWGGQSGVKITFIKKIKPGSGIGSSAASSVAAVFGFNHLIGEPFTLHELIEFAMEGEKLVSEAAHADNVAPCMLGGFTLVRSYEPLDIIQISYPEELKCTVVHPDIEIRTADSRKVLRSEIPLKDAVTQTGNASALIAGLIKKDIELIGRSISDLIAEPYKFSF